MGDHSVAGESADKGLVNDGESTGNTNDDKVLVSQSTICSSNEQYTHTQQEDLGYKPVSMANTKAF